MKKKSKLADKMTPFLKNLHEKNKVIIQNIRCNRVGENKTLKEKCQGTTGLAHIKFEFTPRDTPQYNGTVERAFTTLCGQVRSMSNSAALTNNLRNGLWTECAATATFLDNMITTTDKPSPFEKFYGKPSPLVNKLRSFGELVKLK